MTLNRGLSLLSLRSESGNLPFRTEQGWTQVDLSLTPAAHGQPVTLTLHYQGSLLSGRNAYSKVNGGRFMNPIEPPAFMSYAGQEVAFLQGFGSTWYPLLWTQEAVQQGFRLPIDRLQVRFPASYQVWSSTGTVQRSADGQWIDVLHKTRTSLPEAASAALANPQHHSFDQATLFYRASSFLPQKEQAYTLQVQQLLALHHWLAPAQQQKQQWKLVVVPFLQTPAIGAGLPFLPETSSLSYYGSYSQERQYDQAASKVAMGWWNTMLQQTKPYSATKETKYIQNPEPAFSIADSSRLNTLLSAYSAAVTTDRLVGKAYLSKTMHVCQRLHDNTLPGFARTKDPKLDQILHQEMLRLGTACDSGGLYLYHIQQEIGQGTLTHFLQNQAQHSQGDTTLHFLQQRGVTNL
uniref:Uncharacterized protein n=1 Tax=Thermosporothrix sp. COM3 TaxID=2490863 RepID=A0A455SJ06_9CHLR|nr:hypothetical protein KTC_20520 [Thermosporothrix sp. COM3]